MICELAADKEVLLGARSEIARFKKGHPDALAGVIARYQHRLYRFLLWLVGDEATAEDLFQHTWLRVMENIRQFDVERSFGPWLFSVARNLAIDHLRRRRFQSLDEPLEDGSARVQPAAPGSGAMEGLLRSERLARLMAVLNELPAAYREVLTLRFEEEMKLDEIAAVTGASLSTVKSRLRRGLVELRGRLAV